MIDKNIIDIYANKENDSLSLHFTVSNERVLARLAHFLSCMLDAEANYHFNGKKKFLLPDDEDYYCYNPWLNDEIERFTEDEV